MDRNHHHYVPSSKWMRTVHPHSYIEWRVGGGQEIKNNNHDYFELWSEDFSSRWLLLSVLSPSIPRLRFELCGSFKGRQRRTACTSTPTIMHRLSCVPLSPTNLRLAFIIGIIAHNHWHATRMDNRTLGRHTPSTRQTISESKEEQSADAMNQKITNNEAWNSLWRMGTKNYWPQLKHHIHMMQMVGGGYEAWLFPLAAYLNCRSCGLVTYRKIQ